MQEDTDNQGYPDIPGYKIISELGRGGIATVYLAMQESLDRQVALKVMSPLLAMEPDYAERFIREGRTVAQLSHPNIITVYDIGLQQHQLFIAMEYIPGGNMRTLMDQHQHDPEWALSIAGQIALALGYAHKVGIVHRDVKPENILFRENGSAVLTDFGIAKTITSNTNLTRAGTIIGTPKYMSPEQTDGLGNDPRTDIYSLGIILFEMLTGKVPYDSENSMAVLYAHVHSPIPELPEELSDLQPLMNSMLAKNADERASDCDELAEIIRITRRERHYALKDPARMQEAAQHREQNIAASASTTADRKRQAANKTGAWLEWLKQFRERLHAMTGNNEKKHGKTIAAVLLAVVILLSVLSIWSNFQNDTTSSDNQLAETNIDEGSNAINTLDENGDILSAPTIATPATKLLPASEPATQNAVTPGSAIDQENAAEYADIAADREIKSARKNQKAILISRFLADESNDELVTRQRPAALPANEEKKPAALSAKQKSINSLLNQAKKAITQEHIITPPEANAIYYYRQVLELSPRNKRALRGLEVSGDIIHEDIRKNYSRDDRDIALQQIDEALALLPGHKKLLSFRNAIEASFNLNSSFARAEKLYRGVDGVKDTGRAAFYYLKAAELGHVQAMNNVAVAYADGEGIPRNDQLAMKWLLKAAKQENSEAMYNLALGYLFSEAGDAQKALPWVQKAADLEYRPAYMLAGWMKTTGTGTSANRFSSIAWELKGMVNPISETLHAQYRIPRTWQDKFMVEYRAATNTGP